MKKVLLIAVAMCFIIGCNKKPNIENNGPFKIVCKKEMTDLSGTSVYGEDTYLFEYDKDQLLRMEQNEFVNVYDEEEIESETDWLNYYFDVFNQIQGVEASWWLNDERNVLSFRVVVDVEKYFVPEGVEPDEMELYFLINDKVEIFNKDGIDGVKKHYEFQGYQCE